MTERMLADVAAAHSFNYCALRYFNVAGADPQGRSGQSTAGATHLIKVAVEAAIGKRSHVSVYGTDYNTSTARASRLYPCQRPSPRRTVDALEKLIEDPPSSHVMKLRLQPGLFGPRSARQRRPGDQRQDRAPMEDRRAGDP
jgi:UDP-glucose 4-epimerase